MKDFKNLDHLLETLTEKRIPGVASVITQGDQVIYENYFGMADVENQKKLDKQTVFRIYSMTKLPIYTLSMMLYERGLFLLDDPLYDYFPEYKHVKRYELRPNGDYAIVPLEKPIQIRHILTMSMGLPYGNGDRSPYPTEDAMCKMHHRLQAQGPYTLREEIRAAAEVPVAFEPGTHWMYGFASELTAGLCELLTGKEIEQALKDELFDPLEMTSTGMRFFGDIPERLSKFYVEGPDGCPVIGEPRMDNKHLPGAENLMGCPRIFSNASDFAKLGMMLANGGVYKGRRIIGSKTIDLMRRNQLNATQLRDFESRVTFGYGYGCGVRTLMDPARAGANGSIGEFGWEGGSGPYFLVDPSEKLSMTLMYQRGGSDLAEIHLKFRNVAYGCL